MRSVNEFGMQHMSHPADLNNTKAMMQKPTWRDQSHSSNRTLLITPQKWKVHTNTHMHTSQLAIRISDEAIKQIDGDSTIM